MMDLVHIWYDDRYRFRVLFSDTQAHAHDLRVKVTGLEIKLSTSFFAKCLRVGEDGPGHHYHNQIFD